MVSLPIFAYLIFLQVSTHNSQHKASIGATNPLFNYSNCGAKWSWALSFIFRDCPFERL